MTASQDGDQPRTSMTHPLRVDWLGGPAQGRVGLTLAPGKHARSALHGGCWRRDLGADLDRLVQVGVDHLVCLLDDVELHTLGIPALPQQAELRGIRVHRLPILDGGVPDDLGSLAVLLARIRVWLDDGERIVLHCAGGLGRSGAVAGCLLADLGMPSEEILAELHRVRGPNCPETTQQERFISSFSGASSPSWSERVAGLVLGAAIGDAMGHPTEFVGSFEDLHLRWPPAGVQGFELYWERDGRRFAPYTDDTQMAEVVLRSLLLGRDASDDLDATMGRIAAGFIDWAKHPQGGHRAPGNACMAGCRALADGAAWSEAGGARAGGCGSVMRAYPFGLLFADDLERAERWAVEHSKLTHRDPIAFAACAAMAVGTALCLHGQRSMQDVAVAMIQAAGRHSPPTARMMQRAVDEATSGEPPEISLRRLQGWAAHEAIAAGLYVALRHAADPAAAILEAANTPGDSDSIATLVGALLGAREGLRALPPRWVAEVERVEVFATLARRAASRL